MKMAELKAELRSYLGPATVLAWAHPKFWPRLRCSLPPAASPDLAMSQSTTLHSLQSYPSSTAAQYQDPELLAATRYQSNPRAALLYSPLQPVSAAGCRAGGTLYAVQTMGRNGGGGVPTYYATSTSSRGGTAISHIYQVVE
jgi:hypothetical protein